MGVPSAGPPLSPPARTGGPYWAVDDPDIASTALCVLLALWAALSPAGAATGRENAWTYRAIGAVLLAVVWGARIAAARGRARRRLCLGAPGPPVAERLSPAGPVPPALGLTGLRRLRRT
ncbi:hypothetical protein [Streptomyces sp. NPDC020141]|uniref:hypothetical protein n=1 Tax=Streptomyces sp. NPDC020141 TaxID=3365065 RepID=UPI0037991319